MPRRRRDMATNEVFVKAAAQSSTTSKKNFRGGRRGFKSRFWWVAGVDGSLAKFYAYYILASRAAIR